MKSFNGTQRDIYRTFTTAYLKTFLPLAFFLGALAWVLGQVASSNPIAQALFFWFGFFTALLAASLAAWGYADVFSRFRDGLKTARPAVFLLGLICLLPAGGLTWFGSVTAE